MGRIIKTLLLLILCISISISQCPDLPNNTTVNGSVNTTIDMCGAMPALFEVNDPNLPSGTIDWYSSTISGFDPLISGTLLGQSSIDSADPCDAGGCPSLEAIYLNACGPGDENLNEFVVFASGSGFLVDNFSFNFDPGNIGGSVTNGNINVGGICTWEDGDASLFTGCASVIPAGLGDYIPPNSLVILQSSSFSSSAYDISSLCGLSDCIYVISNSCDRVNAAFKNYDAGNGTTRTNSIALNCGCSDQITYTVNDPGFAPFSGDGSYVLSDGTTFGNNGCNVGPSIGSIPQFAYSAVTDDFNHSFTDTECNTTQYVVGVLNSTQFNTDCCSEQITEEYTFDIACITAELQGMAALCPGECEEITVLIMGGEAPYVLDLSFTGLPFPFDNISIPFASFPLDEKITICFDTPGPLVDEANFTINIPAIAGGFSGSLTMNTIVDNNGCAGTINGSSVSVSFNNEPDIINPGEQEACDIGDGTGIFILADLTSIINNNSGQTVNYYSDPDGLVPISDPHITSGGPIYAQIIAVPCNSEIIEIPLTVISNGDAGVVSFFCTDPVTGQSTDCTICDDDGVGGQDITLTIFFENSSLNYDYEVVWTTISGPSSTINGSGVGTATFTYTVFETTTFVISVVTADGDCPDMTDLGDVVTVNYSLQPDLDEPDNLSDCGAVILPDILGDLVPANAAYYSESGATGTMYNPGDVIIMTTTLYLYAGIDGCEVEYEFEVVIEDEAIIDDPADVVTCGVYSLPEITGTNIDNASYYTEINGAGSVVSVGTIISTSVVLYLFDSNCGGNQPTLDITITPGPVIDNNTDTIVCEMYIVEPISGIDLSGNEMYFDTIDGNGLVINVGDTLTQDSILFIYDNTGGCEVQIPIFIYVQQKAYPGLDTAIVLCEGDPTLININEELGGDLPDLNGTWLDVNGTGLIIDSSQVDFSSLSPASYIFEYQIQDSICVDTQSILTVNIIGTPNAGDDAALSLCSDTMGVNVLNLIGNPDSGTFYNEANMIATFDPVNASFDASTVGTTVYTYIVGNPASSCGADSSIFTVIVEGSISAGDDVTTNACAGLVLNLDTLLINNSGIGIFEETSPSGGLTGSIFDTEEVEDGMYTILHILPGMGSCPSDTAILIITVTDAPNAGDEFDITLCGETMISLIDLVNGDLGGQFYFNNALLPSGDIEYLNETGILEYLYVVGDGVDCPLDTAILTVTRSIKPQSFLNITLTDLCNEDCTTVTFNVANSGVQTINVFYHIESNMGEVENRTQGIGDLMPNIEVTFCIGIGDLSNNELQPGTEYIFSLDSIAVDDPDCVYIDTSSVSFNTYVSFTGSITGPYCTDDQVMIGSDTYDKDTPSGTTIIPNKNQTGCDSTFIVDLTFGDFVEEIYMENLCEGESIFVNGIEYTATDTTSDFTIPNGSINGCDSLIKLRIIFFESTMEPYSETICSGDTTSINGEDFFLGYLNNSQTLANANSMGCDSMVEVTITIDDPVTFTYAEDFCSSYSEVINGTTYDQSNPTGIELFEGQASNGCDSVVMINFTFNQQAINSSFTLSICDNSYSITIGTETFDILNPIGNAILFASTSAECDTVVTVELTFGTLGVDFMELDGGCTVTDSGFVIIESTTGVIPLDIIYNGNNLNLSSFPFALQLPNGAGQIFITDAIGCETVLPYELFSGGGENYIISEDQGQITITGGTIDSISWTPTDGLSCTDCIDPIAQPSQTTTYLATVFFDDSCSVELSIDVVIIDNTPDYILPSVFSPNGDNMNDNFILTITDGAIGIPQSMLIYDRWGNRVYTGIGEDLLVTGWDGTRGGRDVIPGVYVYQITILKNEKLVSIYGDITVVR